ncbi:MAG: YgiT-type zinc finger protein [Leptospiraceae bacterium]|nr:YgiT-type zinc finger protein [Leptospiraceae bacterium]
MSIETCGICGNKDLSTKKVEKVLRGGYNTTIVKVDIIACNQCGERYYTPETIRYFERIRKELKSCIGIKQFKKVGVVYQVA